MKLNILLKDKIEKKNILNKILKKISQPKKTLQTHNLSHEIEITL
jgi:hypothetical protein